MKYTDLSEGDKVIFRNGSTAVVVTVEKVKPTVVTFYNSVRLTFTDSTEGFFTEDLNLSDDLEAPLDIVEIIKEYVALLDGTSAFGSEPLEQDDLDFISDLGDLTGYLVTLRNGEVCKVTSHKNLASITGLELEYYQLLSMINLKTKSNYEFNYSDEGMLGAGEWWADILKVGPEETVADTFCLGKLREFCQLNFEAAHQRVEGGENNAEWSIRCEGWQAVIAEIDRLTKEN